jgi:hypothetical protein
MAQLFTRYIAATVETALITGLRMAFKVTSSTEPEPNVCELSIYNLNGESRSRLQKDSSAATQIDAGYNEQHEILFLGNLRRVTTTRHGPDWITTLKAGDGETKYRTSTINEAFAPGTPIITVIKTMAQRLGVSLGDAEKRITSATHRTGLTQYINGLVSMGFTKDQLTESLRGLNLNWSIQDGTLQILAPNDVTNEPAIVLGPTTGLVGSPAAGEKGRTKVTALLNGGIRPGRKLQLDAINLKGFFRVEKVVHSGDTHGQPWYSEAEVKPL